MKKIIILSLFSLTGFARTFSFIVPNEKIITSYISSCEDGGKLFLRNRSGGDSEFKLSSEINCEKAKKQLTLIGVPDSNSDDIFRVRVTVNTNRMTAIEIVQE